MSTPFERMRLHRARAEQQSRQEGSLVGAKTDVAMLGREVGSVDKDLLQHLANLTEPVDVSVSRAEVEILLEKLIQTDRQSTFGAMINGCRDGVLQSFAGAVGLGAIVSHWDKDGGNVDTINNVRQGTYATTNEKRAYDNRGEYNTRAYHSHQNYKAVNRAYKQEFEAGELQDTYTGATLKPGVDKLNLDHVTAAYVVHHDAGRVLAEVDGPDLANRSENLRPTNKSTNSSKQEKTAAEYWASLEVQAQSRRAEISALEGVTSKSVEQETRLYKLKKKEAVSKERLENAEKNSSQDSNRHLNGQYYTSGKFVGRVVLTSAVDAAKVGAQQALGAAIAEFFLGVFAEIEDWHKDEQRVLMLEARLKRVVNRVTDKWKDYGDIALQGAVAGFLSGVATALINIFVQTEKRLVRMIREGFFSITRSIKVVLFPPGDMTTQEALHASTKLLFAGTILIGGIAVEEVIIAHLHAAGFAGIFDFAVPVIVGSLTAVAMALSTFALDRLDLFDAEANAQHERIQAVMGNEINQSIVDSEKLLLTLQSLGPI